jgi:hypothetical protein
MASERKQFRVLYREFLFRLIDLELLPNPEDMVKLVGQLVAMLAAFNLMFSSSVRRVLSLNLSTAGKLEASLGDIHFLIASTMVAAGMLAVLCWDSTFPDRRDVLVLAPLPVRTRTLFGAKLAAILSAMLLTVVTVNVFTGITYPIGLGNEAGRIGAWIFAYWVTVVAAGLFVLSFVLGLQGLAAQWLPKQANAVLQLGCFVGFLGVYFLQPPLSRSSSFEGLKLLPSYWFLGVFANLAGVDSPLMVGLGELGRVAIGIAVVLAVLSLGMAYRRTMRKLVEEPDIAPNQRIRLRLPAWGDTLTMALTNFTLKTMLRSKQHRLLYALYLGIGFAFALACARRMLYGTGKLFVADVRGPLLVASLLLLCCAVLGMRVVMTIPIALRANWVFRITMLRDEERYLGAVRRAFVGLGLGPVLIVLGLVFAVLWPIHVVVLGLWAWILVECALAGFAKIPFACSYLPGKANLHVRSGAFALVLVGITDVFVDVEKRAFVDLRTLVWMLAALLGVGWVVRWRGMRNRKPIAFEEVPAKDIHAMELYRDGKLALD